MKHLVKDTEIRLETVLEEKEMLEREKEQIVIEKDEAVKKSTAMLAKIKLVEQNNNQLQTQVFEAEETCGEFKVEAEKTIDDYCKLSEQLKETETQLLDVRKEKDKYFNLLSKRGEEVRNKEKMLEEQSRELNNMEEQLRKKENDLVKQKAHYEGEVDAIRRENAAMIAQVS